MKLPVNIPSNLPLDSDLLNRLTGQVGSAVANLTSGVGIQVVIGTKFGSFTVDPSAGTSTPGDGQGGSGVGSFTMGVFRLLGVTISLRTPAGDFGPFQVGNE